MKQLAITLWHDDSGVTLSTELILITTVLVIGAIVGLSTFRDQLVQEFGDAALAVSSLNQSYSFSGATVGGFTVAGSIFTDTADDCDGADPPGSEPACISVAEAAVGE
jgi:hypothetical protein